MALRLCAGLARAAPAASRAAVCRCAVACSLSFSRERHHQQQQREEREGQWRWSKAAAAVGAALGIALAAAPLALCRPLDTPDYLLPYYLRDARSRFNHYASIRKKGGRRYMTAEDFLCAVLALKETNLEDPTAADDLRHLFAAVDANGDGRLCFAEFSLLMVLLSTPRADWEVAFTVFDEAASGALSCSEFARAVAALGDGSVAPQITGGLAHRLFGRQLSRRCTLPQLLALVDDLQLEVTKAEFRRFDTKRRGAITPAQFAELIASQMLGSHLPFYMIDNLRRLHSHDGGGSSSSARGDDGLVPFSMYASFSRIMRSADTIGEAIRLYTRAGKGVKRADLNNAVKAVGLAPLSAQELDLVFALFDRDGDGTLEYEEFLSIIRSKVSFHVRGRPRVKERLWTRLTTCAQQAMTAGRD